MYALEVEDIYKTYSSGTTALNGVSLKIEKGDFYALLGHNGAGKSTLINIISSITNPTSGAIKIMGNDLLKEGYKARPYLGVVNQEFNFANHETVNSILFYNATYFGMPFGEAKRRSQAWIEMLGLESFQNKAIHDLSGGMKRRVMIARALIHNPKILILDEPTAGVDVTLRRDLWDFLIRLNKSGTTIILTTHYLEEAEYLCRNIGIIQKGNLIVNTSMRKFLTENTDGESFILDMEKSIIEPLKYQQQNFSINSINKDQLRVYLNSAGNLNQVFDYLHSKGFIIKSLRNESNRLENIFMQYDTERNR